MNTIVRANIESVRDLMTIYDSANELFCTEDRAYASEDTFYRMIESNVYIMYKKKQLPIAFMAFVQKERYTEMTALYVRIEYQKSGLGHTLIDYFENLISDKKRILIIKALKNAPWAIDFYIKHGYKVINHEMAIELNIKEHPWTIILFKVYGS